MNNFEFYTPTKVYFGRDEEQKVGRIIKGYNAKKVLIHYGGGSAQRSGLIDLVKRKLDEESIEYVELGGVKPNPELKLVREGIELVRRENVDFILAVGGGSVLDSAKDIANGAANPEFDVWDFSVKKAAPLRTMKKGAILTIAAAGSEMSDSCVITDGERGLKRGYGSPFNRMDFAIEDPVLSFTVSPYQTACGAVDIAMHTIERFFCLGENTTVTDAVAIAVIKSIIKSGEDAYNNPEDYEARANMMWESSLAHNGLTQCGRSFLLTVHQLEHEVSGMFPEVAHGAGLAALWCSWARYVYKYSIPRFIQYAHEVWNVEIDYEHPETTIERAIDMQEEYYKRLGMPTSLRELNIPEDALVKLAENCSFGRTRKLPGYCELGFDEMLAIYRMAY